MLTIVKPFSFIWYVIPLLKAVVLALTRDLFLRGDGGKTKQKPASAWPIATIGRNTCPMVASSGFYQSPGLPPLGTGAPPRPSKWPAKLVIFLLSFCLLLPWQLLGQYGASSHLMAVYSGFWGSPGHAPSGNALYIAPAHRHGHWNGQQRRCICSSLPPFLYDNA